MSLQFPRVSSGRDVARSGSVLLVAETWISSLMTRTDDGDFITTQLHPEEHRARTFRFLITIQQQQQSGIFPFLFPPFATARSLFAASAEEPLLIALEAPVDYSWLHTASFLPLSFNSFSNIRLMENI